MLAADNADSGDAPPCTGEAPVRPRSPGSPRRALLLARDEVERLLAATAGERFAVRDRALLEVLYGSAIRASEAMRLKVEDLELDARRGEILGKGKRRRRVFLPAAAVAAVRAHLEAERIERGYVFRNRDGKRMTRQLIRRIVVKYAAKAGIPPSSPHSLRHSTASHLLAAGAYLYAVKDVLGHVHAATTARYLHWIDPGESTEAIFHRLHPRA